jgi:hypothetical protein
MPLSSKALAKMINPVFPKDFADDMTRTIHSLNSGFYCGGKIRDGFIQFCNVYNYCLSLNQKKKVEQLVIPAATGSGKSVSATLYLSILARLGMSGLLVVSEVSVAIEAAERINELAGEKLAGVFYSKNEKNPAHELWCPIDSLPNIIVITHAMFIQRSDSGKDIDALKTYNGKQRELVIIDERIDLVKRVSFDTDEFNDAIGILVRDTRLMDIGYSLSSLKRNIYKFKTDMVIKSTGDIKLRHIKMPDALISLYIELSKGKYDLIQKMKGRKHSEDLDRANVIDFLQRIQFVISGDYSQTVEGGRIVCHREEDLSCKFGSVVVLDATSRINPEYDYRNANNHKIEVFNQISSRNYSNVNLNLCSLPGPKQSKYAIYTKPKSENKHNEKVLAYLKLIEPLLKPNDRLLVVTYKCLVPIFMEHSPYGDQIKFIHWGSRDARGSNEFKDFNKAMTVGWYRRPRHYYVASIMAINQIDKYVHTNGSAYSDAKHLRDMLIVDDMIQFFNRIRCRTAIDQTGNCEPVELYCLTGGDQLMEDIIKQSITSEMPGVVINDWKPKEMKSLKHKVTVVEKRAENLVYWLLGKLGQFEEISLDELRQEFGLSKHTLSRTVKSEYFINLLEEEGIVKVTTNSWGNPVKFVLSGSGIKYAGTNQNN